MDIDNKYGIKEIQEKLLESLLYFQRFCDENKLRFVLAGGTCLGAARDQGMIPWDDDLDVFMLREDYERLQTLWEKHGDKARYTLLRSNDKINIHHAATELRDNNTTFIVKHSADLDINQGLMIDIIPLDNVAATEAGRKLQAVYAMLFSCFNFQRLPEHKSKAIYIATKTALTVVRSFKSRYLIWKHAEKKVIELGKKNNGLVASFTEGPKIFNQRFPRKWFEKPAYLMFEGHLMPVPADYDKWLTVSYGDYMTPIPEAERVLRHDIVYWNMAKSYKEYKGIYYCVNKETDK